MLKDKDKMIYECNKCKAEETSKDGNIFLFLEYSAFRPKDYDIHLCFPCYENYYIERDSFIDKFLGIDRDGEF